MTPCTGPIIGIIQARIGSARLPGKVLAPVADRPLLGLLVERLRHCRRLDGLGIATSTQACDDAVDRFAGSMGLTCWRGPLDDVAGRFRLALEASGAAAFVRINGDSPLLDPALVDRALALYGTGDWDLVSNVVPRSFPKGQSVEVLRTGPFLAAETLMDDPLDREHVTRFFHRHAGRYRMVGFTSGRALQDIQLAVDDADDLTRADRIARSLGEIGRAHV